MSLQLPHEYVSEVGARDEVFELLTHNQVRDVIFIGGERLILKEEVAIGDAVETSFKLRPGEDDTLLLINFEAFDPKRHLFELDLRTEFEVHSMTLWIQK